MDNIESPEEHAIRLQHSVGRKLNEPTKCLDCDYTDAIERLAVSSKDVELNLRDRLANIVAAKVSGIKDAIPEHDDYNMADRILDLIEEDCKS
jgi:hypothetical protein